MPKGTSSGAMQQYVEMIIKTMSKLG